MGSPRILEISILGDAVSHCLAVDNNASLRAWLEDSADDRIADTDDATIYNDTLWHNMVYTFSGADSFLYVDGIETDTASEAATNLDDGPYLTIGAVMDTTLIHSDHCFQGFVDEVRISDTFRSAQWIRAQYASMTDTIVTFGSEE